jgi:signal peptidase
MIGKIFKITINTILGLLVALGIFVVFSFVPFPGNYKLFTVQSGSMEPNIHTGSLIFVKPEKDYSTGDIVTRKTTDPKVTITHRISSKEEKNGKTIFHTKGDANNGEDMENVAEGDIIGKEIFKIPYLGYPVGYAKTSQGLILLIVIPAVIIIYDEMQKIKKEIERKIDYRRRSKKREENNLETHAQEKEEKI